MSTLLITKKTPKTWLHEPSDQLQFIIGKFTFSIDGDDFQIVELGQSKRNKYNFANITVVDETTTTTYDNFTSIVELSETLEMLGYPAFLRDGEVTGVASVNGLTGIVVVDGDNITVTDPTTSTDADLNEALQNIFDSGGGGTPTLQEVTTEGNETTNIVKFVVDADNYIEIDTVNLSIKVYADGVLFNDINQEGIINYAFGNPDYYSSLTNGALFVGSLLSSDASIFDLNKIINNGVDYSLPTGASSQIATLADITGGGGYTVVSSNTTASNDTNYTVVANSTFTDPSPTEGKGYVVYVRNGTATIGGTGYSVGSLVFRVFHSGAWSTREYKSNLTASDIPSGIDAVKIADGSVSNTEFQYINSLTSNAQTQLDLRVRTLLNDNVDSSAVTGTVANTILKSYLIPANTLAVGDTIDFKSVCSKVGTNANSNFRLYTNTSNSLTGASALALVSPSATNLYFSLDRTYTLKSGNTLESFPVGSTAPTDEVATTTAISNTAFNPSVDNYFIVAIQPNNAGDSFKQTLCYITLMKAKTSI